MASSFLRFLDHTQRRTIVGRTPLDEWSARRRDLYLTTHNTHNRQHIHAPGGIRTHDISRRTAVDLRLRQRGYRDRLLCFISLSNSSLVLTFHIWFSFVGPNILLKIFLSKTQYCTSFTVRKVSYKCRNRGDGMLQQHEHATFSVSSVSPVNTGSILRDPSSHDGEDDDSRLLRHDAVSIAKYPSTFREICCMNVEQFCSSTAQTLLTVAASAPPPPPPTGP